MADTATNPLGRDVTASATEIMRAAREPGLQLPDIVAAVLRQAYLTLLREFVSGNEGPDIYVAEQAAAWLNDIANAIKHGTEVSDR